MVCLSVCLSVAASEARAQEYYAADYYFDGENLWLIEGWQEPFVSPDPESDFETMVYMPPYSGGGGGGSGLVEGTEPSSKKDQASDDASLLPSTSITTENGRRCSNRVCPDVIITGRRGLHELEIVRVFFIQDSGHRFRAFARLFRPRNYHVSDLSYNCGTESAERGRRARQLALLSGVPNRTGDTYTFLHSGGVDVFRNISASSAVCMVSTTCTTGDTTPNCP